MGPVTSKTASEGANPNDIQQPEATVTRNGRQTTSTNLVGPNTSVAQEASMISLVTAKSQTSAGAEDNIVDRNRYASESSFDVSHTRVPPPMVPSTSTSSSSTPTSPIPGIYDNEDVLIIDQPVVERSEILRTNTQVSRRHGHKGPLTESDIKYGFLDDFEGNTLDDFNSFDLGRAANARPTMSRSEIQRDASGSFFSTLLYPFRGERHHRRGKLQRLKSLALLPTWIPVYHWKYIAGPATIILFLFFAVGSALYFKNSDVVQLELDYTLCSSLATETMMPFPREEYARAINNKGSSWSSSVISYIKSVGKKVATSESNRWIREWKFENTTRTCTIRFQVPIDLQPNLMMYVGLSEFYQNHRMYLYSKDTDQLKGKEVKNPGSLSKYCGFLRYANCTEAAHHSWLGGSNQARFNVDCIRPSNERDPVVLSAAAGAQYYPCGLIANSVFSDEISPLRCIPLSEATNASSIATDDESQNVLTEVYSNCSTVKTYEFSEEGIAWENDAHEYSLGNIAETMDWATKLSDKEINTRLIPPPQWRKPYFMGGKYVNGYNRTNLPDLRNWERLRVWMRPAGLPRFRKLWGRNNRKTLPYGVYEVSVSDFFNVRRFGGTKAIVISTVGPTGSRGSYVGLAMIAVAAGAAISLAFAVFVHPRKKGDLSKLSWITGKDKTATTSKDESYMYDHYSGDEDALYDNGIEMSSRDYRDQSALVNSGFSSVPHGDPNLMGKK